MGEIITNPPTVPNTVVDSWQPLVDRDVMSYMGAELITLTEWAEGNTTVPKIGQGSYIDINGSIARFPADEAIAGSPADGTIYIEFIVAGAVVTPSFTATAPTWDKTKGGWYGPTGNRYASVYMTKAGAVYSSKTMSLGNGNVQLDMQPGLNAVRGNLDVAGAIVGSGIKSHGTSLKWKVYTGSASGNSVTIPYSKTDIPDDTVVSMVAVQNYTLSGPYWVGTANNGNPSINQGSSVIQVNSLPYSTGAVKVLVIWAG